MLSYAAVDFGALRLAIKYANGFCNIDKNDGSLMMSGSAKRLYRKPSTSSVFSGPPRFNNNTPSFKSFPSDDDDDDGIDDIDDGIDDDDDGNAMSDCNTRLLLIRIGA